MIEFYKTTDIGTIKISEPETGCWINVIAPTENERNYLIDTIGVLPEFVKSSLDPEESSHIDFDDELHQTLVIVDYPSLDNKRSEPNIYEYFTYPLGIVIIKGFVVTISLYESWTISELMRGQFKGIDTRLKTRFTLMILLRISQRFLLCLREIDQLTNRIENQLLEQVRNKELLQLLDLEKSLVYFSTSLKSDEATLNRIRRGKAIKLYEEDDDLLEDILIEIRQGVEMCSIYSGILSGMRDAFSSVINNNMNDVMKFLSIITIIMSIPNIIFAFYGMNVKLPVPYVWFPTLVCLISCIIAWIVFSRNKRFK
ncbi:magnesium transporter CorA family protein [Catenisphaera adipataccumulans]|jgi:magnesium transporter|uniref:Magnesium transporter n=1 Tax=Catenisphaera adipataccumulans TaxID=700500 RepID=A0A7W8CUS9_9FIRM|nr:magnesium transporter CorA family protein [Catenisphaera adipataccumulans]MBB5182037.1 magnesium transporter [Catenisphaera adipataccumulans]